MRMRTGKTIVEPIDHDKKDDTKVLKTFPITVLCIIIGGIFRVLYCLKYTVPVRDSIGYAAFIKNWISSGIESNTRTFPPLALYFVKTVSPWFNYDVMKTGRIINILFGLAIIIVAIKLTAVICKSNLAMLMVGLICATHPTLIHFSCQMLRENPYLFFCTLAAFTATKYYIERKTIYLYISGMLSSAAFLCRFEGGEVLIALIILVFLNSGIKSIKKKSVIALILIGSFLGSFFIISEMIGVSPDYYLRYQAELRNK